MLLILFLCLLTNVETWKKAVSLSPKAAQLRRDLRTQNSSSWSFISEYSLI
ncbi:hypothetical protein ACB094_12G176800 [Castanea mollissima]